MKAGPSLGGDFGCTAQDFVIIATLPKLPNDIRVGLITIIGLSAKNAILIIEPKDLQAEGKRDGVCTEAAPHPLNDVTGLHVGVLPLYIRAQVKSQRAIGIPVFATLTAQCASVLPQPHLSVVMDGN
jgi:multidrug efflux pump subunit AcrB